VQTEGGVDGFDGVRRHFAPSRKRQFPAIDVHTAIMNLAVRLREVKTL
jgi:hypothetical protein